jgi:hypothetical protein
MAPSQPAGLLTVDVTQDVCDVFHRLGGKDANVACDGRGLDASCLDRVLDAVNRLAQLAGDSSDRQCG